MEPKMVPNDTLIGGTANLGVLSNGTIEAKSPRTLLGR